VQTDGRHHLNLPPFLFKGPWITGPWRECGIYFDRIIFSNRDLSASFAIFSARQMDLRTLAGFSTHPLFLFRGERLLACSITTVLLCPSYALFRRHRRCCCRHHCHERSHLLVGAILCADTSEISDGGGGGGQMSTVSLATGTTDGYYCSRRVQLTWNGIGRWRSIERKQSCEVISSPTVASAPSQNSNCPDAEWKQSCEVIDTVASAPSRQVGWNPHVPLLVTQQFPRE